MSRGFRSCKLHDQLSKYNKNKSCWWKGLNHIKHSRIVYWPQISQIAAMAIKSLFKVGL